MKYLHNKAVTNDSSYSVYFLQSLKDKGFYIGCTSLDPKIRLEKYHNKGIVKSTKHRRPWVLVHVELYSNKHDAYKREFFLKSPAGYQEKLEIIRQVID